MPVGLWIHMDDFEVIIYICSIAGLIVVTNKHMCLHHKFGMHCYGMAMGWGGGGGVHWGIGASQVILDQLYTP